MFGETSGSRDLEVFKSFLRKLKSGIKKDTKVNCIELSSYFNLIDTFKELR